MKLTTYAKLWSNILISEDDIDLTIIIPVYNNADTLDALLADLDVLQKDFRDELEIIFVIDGSNDKSGTILEESLKLKNRNRKVIHLSRNFGSFEAIRCGMKYSRGRYLVVKSADLQEPKHLIQDFYGLLTSGNVDIVFGRRLSRNDGFITNVFSKIYWKAYRKFINAEIPVGGIDIFGCTSKVSKLISQFSEKNSSLLGLLYWIGFKRGYVDYERKKGLNRKSAWSISKKFKYAFDSIFSFTGMPIVAIQIIGLFGILFSVIISLIIIVLRLNGKILVPGYTALMIVILFSMSAILTAVGIVGSYAWRAFENTKQRPSTIVRVINE